VETDQQESEVADQLGQIALDQLFWLAPTAQAVVRVHTTAAPSARLLSANRSLYELVGASPGELTDSPFDRLVTHPTGSTAASALLAAGCGRLGWSGVLHRIRGGSGVQVQLNAAELTTADARDFIVSIVPVEPRRLALAPPSRLTFLQNIVENSPALIYIKDERRRFVYVNSHYAEHFGFRPEQVVGQTNDFIFPPDLAQAFDANDELVWATARAHEFEEPAAGPHGAYRSVKFPLFDEYHRVTAVAGISTEITDLKRAQAAAGAARDRAEKASKAKTELLSRMSHELRTPLNAIIGFAQLIERRAESADILDPAGRIIKASTLLLALINELLDQAKIEAGHLDLRIEPVRAVDPVMNALELLRPLAGQCEVVLSVDLHAGLHEFVAADRQRLDQVLLNIVGNGIKYNHRSGAVTVRFEKPAENRLRFLISDTGPGLEPDDLDRLFLPFTRLAAAHRETEGTGLGLALSKALIEAMGGTIGVQPGDGEGSTFYLDLPVAPAPPDAWATILEGARRTVGSGKGQIPRFPPSRILYVENDAANIELARQIFALCPEVTLDVRTTGAAGLAAASATSPDAILIDMHLSDMSGELLFSRLRDRSDTAAIPIAVFSADATQAQVTRMRGAGVQDYITKPVDIIDFLGRVRALIGAHTLDPEAGAG
jgi:PAS domain S-box-containing protein